MERREPLKQLRATLLRRGLPHDYVSRAVQELADHHADLLEARHGAESNSEQAAWQKLGDVEQLSNELVRKYRARSFAGRHPLFTFVVAPLPLVVVLWIAAFFGAWTGLFGTAYLLGNTFDGPAETDFLGATRPLPLWLVLAIHQVVLALPPALVAWWFCRFARRSGQGMRWAVVAAVLVTLLACSVYARIERPSWGSEEMMLIAFGWPMVSGQWTLQFASFDKQALQVLAPLAVLGFAVWRTRKIGIAPVELMEKQRVAA